MCGAKRIQRLHQMKIVVGKRGRAWALGWERLWEDTTKSASLPSDTGSTTSLTTHRMSNLRMQRTPQTPHRLSAAT